MKKVFIRSRKEDISNMECDYTRGVIATKGMSIFFLCKMRDGAYAFVSPIDSLGNRMHASFDAATCIELTITLGFEVFQL